MVCDLRSHSSIERLRRFVMPVTSGNHLFRFVFHFAKHVCLFLCSQAKEHRSFKGELSIILSFNTLFYGFLGTNVNGEIYIYKHPGLLSAALPLFFFIFFNLNDFN